MNLLTARSIAATQAPQMAVDLGESMKTALYQVRGLAQFPLKQPSGSFIPSPPIAFSRQADQVHGAAPAESAGAASVD